jgi:hypothetical protein
MRTILLQDVLAKVRENGHLGWIKIVDASKVVSNASGNYQINPTIFKQKNVNKEVGDEILIFDNKQLNITKLEKDLNKYLGLEVNLFVGGNDFNGYLQKTTIQDIKKELNITDDAIAKMFDYKNKLAFANSSAKFRIENGLISFYSLIKKSEGKNI